MRWTQDLVWSWVLPTKRSGCAAMVIFFYQKLKPETSLTRQCSKRKFGPSENRMRPLMAYQACPQPPRSANARQNHITTPALLGKEGKINVKTHIRQHHEKVRIMFKPLPCCRSHAPFQCSTWSHSEDN